MPEVGKGQGELDRKVKAGSFPLTQKHPGQLKLLVLRSKLPKQSLKHKNKVRRSHHEGFSLETRAELARKFSVTGV